MSLIPKKMFRAHDVDKSIGVFFVMANKHGSDGQLMWRPDSKEVSPFDQHVEDIALWEESELSKSITRLNEIPVSDGTESIIVTQVSMNASPFLKPAEPRE